jgi:hypothetical protein
MVRLFSSLSIICASALATVAIVAAQPNPTEQSGTVEKEISLKYSLKTGTKYTWRLAADQVVVGGKAARINALFSMEAVEHDEKGNTLCRIRVRSDQAPSIATKKLNDPENLLAAVSNRRLSLAGVYDAILDELGNVITGSTSINQEIEIATLSGSETTNQPVEVQNNMEIPSIMAMVLPSVPNTILGSTIGEAIDTIYLPSRYQKLTASAVGNVSQEASGMLMDTVYRRIKLDSVATSDNSIRMHISIYSERRNISGNEFSSRTKVIKDVTTGLVEQIVEYGYRRKGTILTPEYTAVAVLEN